MNNSSTTQADLDRLAHQIANVVAAQNEPGTYSASALSITDGLRYFQVTAVVIPETAEHKLYRLVRLVCQATARELLAALARDVLKGEELQVAVKELAAELFKSVVAVLRRTAGQL